MGENMIDTSKQKIYNYDVLVIGGGLAGLSSARQLKSAGVSVAVLEARDRIGGRLFSQRLDTGHTIDLGAQFIGDAQRRISALVDEVGLTRISPNTTGDNCFLLAPDAEPIFKSGDRLPLSVLSQLDVLVGMWRFEQKLESFQSNMDMLDTISANEFVNKFILTQTPRDFVAAYAEGEMCTSLYGISAYEFLDQLKSTGGSDGEADSAQWYLAEGTQPLAEYIADKLGTSLILSSPVSKIHQCDDCVTVDTATGIYRARQLIVAVPPQLYGCIGLLPQLPDYRRNVIAGFECGHVIKTMLVFESPWWRDTGASGRGLAIGGILNAAVDSSPVDNSLGILTVFSTASSARRLCSQSEEYRIASILKYIQSLSDVSVPKPVFARSIDWNADPYSLGGYASRRGIGGWCQATDLFARVGRIHFAGTETATEWRSFMEGALQSADRAVDDVLDELRSCSLD